MEIKCGLATPSDLLGRSAPRLLRNIIGKYGRDEMKPSIETAKKLANALEVSLDYLVGDAELKVFDKKTLQRIEDIEKLPEEERKVIYKVIDSLLRDAKTKQAYA
ncbi:MAG TPA: helix-turn-helix transcriptional regulator [Ohtaekwangia sp.]|uniref:helix-turn-helix domain-containing protein n=1 Tax=Ohtaekwangia sp. TaxID=2066019 RepID=UPI002FB431F9